MDQETIKALADQITDQTILTSWKTWGLQFSLWIVGTALAAFAGAFFAKRGEHKAIQADFNLLKMQLAENTTAVKTIETEIAHADWAAREWKTIQRIKLEELVKHLNLLIDELPREAISSIRDGNQSEQASPQIRDLDVITNLYFPELSNIMLDLHNEYFDQREWLTNAMIEIHDRTPDENRYDAMLRATETWTNQEVPSTKELILQLKREASKLML